jgi:protein-S-isoprenylcysteine O-methyltransferase Ste14
MGLILAMFAFALVRGRPATLLITLSVAIFFTFKARLEERFLRQEFGAAYDTYSQRVARLVPFLRL